VRLIYFYLEDPGDEKRGAQTGEERAGEERPTIRVAAEGPWHSEERRNLDDHRDGETDRKQRVHEKQRGQNAIEKCMCFQ